MPVWAATYRGMGGQCCTQEKASIGGRGGREKLSMEREPVGSESLSTRSPKAYNSRDNKTPKSAKSTGREPANKSDFSISVSRGGGKRRGNDVTMGDLLNGALEAAGEGGDMSQPSSARSGHSEASRVSGVSSFSRNSSAFGDMSKDERKKAKGAVKDFVQKIVKGMDLVVVLPNGTRKNCWAAITRKLDKLRIKSSKSGSGSKDVQMADVDEILVGADASQSLACEGIDTPLDALSVTMVLSTQDCITFRLPDDDTRDTFVMCISMFATEARQGAVRVVR